MALALTPLGGAPSEDPDDPLLYAARLEQQTVTGILSVEDETAAPKERRYSLPEGHVEVLTDTESLDYMAPLAQLLVGAVSPLPA